MRNSFTRPTDPTSNLIFLTRRGQKWLSQFSPDDQILAMRLVSGLTLISSADFEHSIERNVRHLSESISGPVALYAIREIDSTSSYFEQATEQSTGCINALGPGNDIGSEGRVASLIRSIHRSDKHKYLNHPSLKDMRALKCRCIVCVDDFIGSGSRAYEFLSSLWSSKTLKSWKSMGLIRFIVLSYSSLDDGEIYVKQHPSCPSIIIERPCPSFYDIPWSKQTLKKIEAICSIYGKRSSRPRMALGYHDTMGSMVFEHGCPNNVPSILWGEKKGRFPRKDDWAALFPGRSVTEEEKHAFQCLIEHDPTYILEEIGEKRLSRSGILSSPLSKSHSTLMILSLISKKIRRISALSFASGLSAVETTTALRRCLRWGFITTTLRLTPSGQAELQYARRRRFRSKSDIPIAGGEAYYPRQLRGPCATSNSRS